MKIAVLVARLLLGLMFVVFGLNGFLHFLPQPPMSGPPQQYFMVLSQGGFLPFIFAVQLVSGLLLLAGVFLPLALVLLGPVLVNILLFHILLEPKGLPPGLLATLLWFIVFYGVRENFAGIFRMRG